MPRMLLLVFIGVLWSGVDASCFFPAEYQGTFLMQTQTVGMYGGHMTGATTFSEITFEPDAIPPWGKCHQRRGNNVILKDTTGGEDCMRCFHLTLKTPNVIQIYTEGLGKCYTNEEVVRATCPDDRAGSGRKFKEIMLYRKQESATEEELIPDLVFCPISGKFRFSYSASAGEFRCDQTLSEVSNCPSGSTLGVRFKQCSFPDLEIQFQCLGDWEGPENSRYLALMDLRSINEDRTKFRCGLYNVDPTNGRVYVSLSADSTCFNQLRSPTDGYESLVLTPYPEKSPPPVVRQAHCRFPEWSQGEWEDLEVSNNILSYRDHGELKKVSMTCLRRENSTPEDKFVIFSSTHCGEESFNCVWLKKRSPNVMEFQMGSQPSHIYSDTLCHDLQFSYNNWITQGRKNPLQISPCPITGDYTGILPESSGGLCAKVASDCNNPDVMFYTVSSCRNRSQVYEEREYRCIGSWEEKSGVTFTYTKRREMDGFQCFSGKVLQNGKEAYIKEAGRSCIRGEDPLVYGMKITKHASCPDIGSAMAHNPLYPTIDGAPDHNNGLNRHLPSDPYWYQKKTDRPSQWKPPTVPPESNEIPSFAVTSTSWNIAAYALLISIIVLYQRP